MGLRFRKSVKILPGVRVNFNKNSTSISVGRRGARYTVSSNGKKTATVEFRGLVYLIRHLLRDTLQKIKKKRKLYTQIKHTIYLENSYMLWLS